MSWDTSDRRQFLPKDWSKRRLERLKIDGNRCTAENANTGERCEAEAEEVDHIGRRTDHRLTMLRSLCHWHHALRTAQQAADAQTANQRRIAKSYRRDERHPGAL